jgi:hypothetical protein
LRRRPAELSVVMVNRMLNAGEKELAGIPAMEVLLEISNRHDVDPGIRKQAGQFFAKHAV